MRLKINKTKWTQDKINRYEDQLEQLEKRYKKLDELALEAIVEALDNEDEIISVELYEKNKMLSPLLIEERYVEERYVADDGDSGDLFQGYINLYNYFQRGCVYLNEKSNFIEITFIDLIDEEENLLLVKFLSGENTVAVLDGAKDDGIRIDVDSFKSVNVIKIFKRDC